MGVKRKYANIGWDYKCAALRSIIDKVVNRGRLKMTKCKKDFQANLRQVYCVQALSKLTIVYKRFLLVREHNWIIQTKNSIGLDHFPLDGVLFLPSYSTFRSYSFLGTALSNHMRIVLDEMSSWTLLTMYLGMKTIF